MLAILNEIDLPSDRRPLQCVTFKQPLPEYFRLKEACQIWRLQYSDVIRDFGNLAWPTSAVCFGPPCGTLMLRVFGSAGA
jgi:hypothetical protein